MKLFKSLLIAPATLGLLAPFSAFAGETNLNDISKYTNLEDIDFANNFENDNLNHNSLLAGGEGLVDEHSHDGGFSETTSASFSVDATIGAIDGDETSEATTFAYQYNIGLSTSFTGEDSLDIAIDSGSDGVYTKDNPMAFDTGASLSVDGVTYSFPVGGASVVVGADTDVSTAFTGACTYSAFTDYMSNCGTGSSLGAGGKGVTAAASYAFDSGFSMAAGLSSTSDSSAGILTKEGTDVYGLNAAYTADSYAVSLGYVVDDGAGDTETTYWGINASYTPESESFPSVSVGYETEEKSGTDKTGYFLGLTWSEVGPGSFSLGAGTAANYADNVTEYLVYEASYSYPVNDGLTITPGVFIEEKSGDDLTGVIVKSSFAF